MFNPVDVQKNDFISAGRWNVIEREVHRLSRITVSAPLGIVNSPGTPPHIYLNPQPAPVGISTCRIAGTSSGGINFGAGTYAAFTQSYAGVFGTSGANYPNLHATNNASFDSIGLVDGEEVIVRNLWESTTVANTNRTHVLSAGQFVHCVFRGAILYSGTNTRKLYECQAIPARACDFP